ncbi:tripartite tricarboxylate transporter TctB family protein [Saccharopolyspora endophytica]|uniref:Tripartite tricarboxylate transporter TctB family protein n=1 Tax=Saccharopolyspora endophytica TaxID=543886 RepID=A0ABS5DB99_9PSEU|nr:tripartite tricarboxylate transporter TctB family protein [Saccharopolyspora endophytica]MBQ0923577.1 tripartite tricarboxylate transporter TctB family protein [Saccharopolyspora endophytica]
MTGARAAGRSHRTVPAALTALGALAAVVSVGLGLGSTTQPGPGTWPLVASAGVVLSGAWLTVTGVERPEGVARTDLGRVLAAAGTLALFVVLLPLVGMPVPALVAIVVWLRLFGESWRLTVITAVLAVVSLQIVFVELLAVPLPVGPLAPGS